MKLCFGDIVIVEKNLVGVVVKSWISHKAGKMEILHEVYVRNWRTINEFKESELERYMVRHKELNDEELGWQYNAINNQ